ncbi:MAG: SDR family oxidoreductase [Victivallales bacterium]|nr:SDR family oxidoreductase [Victivallales bacterium]
MENHKTAEAELRTLLSLEGKIALVTGGGRNLGREMALGLAEAGATVAITSRDISRAREATEAMREQTGYDFHPFELELNEEESVVRLFHSIKERFGRLDILVNNGGGHSSTACGLLEKETLQSWNDFIGSNLTGCFLMLREYARLMMPLHSGSVVNIASMAGLVGRDRSIYGDDMVPNPIAYSAAKAGMIGLTTDAAAYLGPYGIRVNAISPGGFERNQPEHFIRDYSNLTMLKRMGHAGFDLKGAAVFLASDASAYITGHNLVIDGGFTKYK